MENKSYFKEFIRYVSQNVFGMIGLSCYILADTFFVAKGLGANGLTALNLAIPIYSFIHGSGLMLGIGGATRYSIYREQKSFKRSNQVFMNSLYIAAVFAVLFMLTGILFADKLAYLLGSDSYVFDMTKTYLRVILLFAPFFIVNNILICFVRNDKNPKLSMLAMLGGSLSNIILDYILIFPMNMGIFGAVLATGLAPIISMLILSIHFFKKQNGFKFKPEKPHISSMLSNILLGLPSLITELSSGIVIIVFNTIILKLSGNIGVAAYGVIANLSLVVVSIYTGIAQGMQPLASRFYGCSDRTNVKKTLQYSLFTSIIVSIAVYLFIFIFAEPIVGIFNSEGNLKLYEIAVYGLRLYFIAAPFVGFNIIVSMFFVSIEKSVPAHIISMLRGLILIIPMSYLLSYLFQLTGVWLTFPITECFVCILSIAFMLYYIKIYFTVKR